MDDVDPEKMIEHLRDVVEHYAEEILFRHAIEALRGLRGECARFLDGTHRWPYAGPMSEASLTDELFWLGSRDPIPDGVEDGLENLCRWMSERRVEVMSEAEKDFLIEACWLDRQKPMTVDDLEQLVRDRLTAEVKSILRWRDSDVLDEAP